MNFGPKTEEKLKTIKCSSHCKEMLPLNGFVFLYFMYFIGTFLFVHKHFIHSLERQKTKSNKTLTIQFAFSLPTLESHPPFFYLISSALSL